LRKPEFFLEFVCRGLGFVIPASELVTNLPFKETSADWECENSEAVLRPQLADENAHRSMSPGPVESPGSRQMEITKRTDGMLSDQALLEQR
jgi:hypothetical protein